MENKNIISGKSVFKNKLEITTEYVIKKVVSCLLIFFVIILLIDGLLASIFSDFVSNISEFTLLNLKETYGWINVKESLEPFLVESKEDKQFYFVSDSDNYMVIIATEKDSDRLDEVIYYTYGYIDESNPVSLKGKVEKITEDMKPDIVESYNYFYSSETIASENFDNTFDKFYLDTTVEPKNSITSGVIYAIILLLVVIFCIKKCIGFLRRIKRAKQIKQEYSASALRYVGDQLDAPTNVCIDFYNVYITLEHLVVCKNKLDIIHLNQIRSIRGDFNGSKFVLDVSLYNNENRTITLSKKAVNQENYRKVLQIIQDRIDNVGNQPTEDMLRNEYEIKEQQLVILEKGTDLSATQRILGFAGALIGVGIGGIVWYLIDKMGYIVGYIGILMVFLGMKGYKLGSGRITKKGFRISLFLSVIVIYICNCIPFVDDILNYYYGQNSVWNMIMAYIRTPQIMFESGNGFTFMLNLILGLFLGIGTGIRLRNSVDSNLEKIDTTEHIVVDSNITDINDNNNEHYNSVETVGNHYSNSNVNDDNYDSDYDGSDEDELDSSYDN